MRQIKFRAWRVASAEMFFDIDINFVFYGGQCHLENEMGEMLTDELSVMQFTGVHDKNGKEIYEGDILRVRERPRTLHGMGRGIPESGWGEIMERLVEVHTEPGMYLCRHLPNKIYNGHLVTVLAHAKDSPDGSVEVIGNIYENAELLGDAKKAG